jgi:hypothetical protein
MGWRARKDFLARVSVFVGAQIEIFSNSTAQFPLNRREYLLPATGHREKTPRTWVMANYQYIVYTKNNERRLSSARMVRVTVTQYTPSL